MLRGRNWRMVPSGQSRGSGSSAFLQWLSESYRSGLWQDLYLRSSQRQYDFILNNTALGVGTGNPSQQLKTAEDKVMLSIILLTSCPETGFQGALRHMLQSLLLNTTRNTSWYWTYSVRAGNDLRDCLLTPSFINLCIWQTQLGSQWFSINREPGIVLIALCL